MDLSTAVPADGLARSRGVRGGFADDTRSHNSAVSWGAVAAGAAAAASLSLILPILGVGLGLSSAGSPSGMDTSDGASGKALGGRRRDA